MTISIQRTLSSVLPWLAAYTTVLYALISVSVGGLKSPENDQPSRLAYKVANLLFTGQSRESWTKLYLI